MCILGWLALALIAGLAGTGAVAVLGDLADRPGAPSRVEIDVQEIADGTVIVTHDSDFMKQAGLPLKVWQATRDDLARIDVGRWFDPAHAGARVPTRCASLHPGITEGPRSRTMRPRNAIPAGQRGREMT